MKPRERSVYFSKSMTLPSACSFAPAARKEHRQWEPLRSSRDGNRRCVGTAACAGQYVGTRAPSRKSFRAISSTHERLSGAIRRGVLRPYAPVLLSAAEQENGLLAEQVPKPPGSIEPQRAAPRVKRYGLLHLGPHHAAQLAEVLDGTEVDIRRVPPGVRQIVRPGHVAPQQELQSDAPMAEVGERHDSVAPDPQHMLEHDAWMSRRLERLGEDNVIESVVRVIGQIGIRVALNDGEALGHAFVDSLAGELDSTAVDSAILRK